MARQARKTAAQVAAKWGQNLAASGPTMTAGVNGVTTSPGTLAAANQNAYLQGVNANVGKWAHKLQNLTLGQWQTAMLKKGLPRVQQAAASDQAKVQAAMGPLLDYVYNARDQINSSMPRGGLQANIARMTAMVNAMAQYKAP